MRVEEAIEKREQTYRSQMEDYSKPMHIKAAARAAMATIREQVLESGEPEWRHDFLIRFLEEERAKYRAQTPDDHDYADTDEDGNENLRGTSLCTCDSGQCKLKHGELPTTVRTADTLAAGILEFRREHSGDPKVLTEAMDAWRDRMAHVADVLELINTALGHEEHVLEVHGAEKLLGDDHEIPEPQSAENEAAA